MGKLLSGLFAWAMSGFVARVLAGAGLAILGSVTLGVFVNYFINKALSIMGNIPMIGLLGVAGVDTAISTMIAGAMIKLYLSSVMQGVKVVRGK